VVVNDRGCCGVRGLQSLSTASPLHKLPFVRLAANGGFEPKLPVTMPKLRCGCIRPLRDMLARVAWHRIPTLRWDCGYRLRKRLRLRAPELAPFWD
jgi:hypothetical protein